MNNALRILTGTGLVVLLGLAAVANGQAETVVFVCTDTLTSTTRTISGARSIIKGERPEVEFVTIQIESEAADIARKLDSIRALEPGILITVGSAATQTALDNFKNIPIVFSSVMYPVISGFVESLDRPGKTITGASLDIPVSIQLRYFRQIVPSLKRLGVLYTTNTAVLIPPARVVAAEMGLELIALQITSPPDVPRALDSIARVAEGLWSVADQNLFDPQTTKYIMLNSLRRGLPFMGFSRYVVESGALFALDFDYKAIGRQAGTTAARILGGENPSSIPVTTPDIIWFHYNENTARHLEVEIPADLIAIAKEVYR